LGLSATLIATGGFGTFPPNPLTQSAGQLFSNSFPVQIIAPFNNILDQIGAPRLPAPQPVTQTTFSDFVGELFSPGFQGGGAATMIPPTSTYTTEPTATEASTATPTETPTATATATPTLTPTLTRTATPTVAATVTPTRTYLPTWTPSPLPTYTPVLTTTIYPTTIPSSGHYISSLTLNGTGSNVTVAGGSSVTVDYTYQVWGSSTACPGCNYQLVLGLDNAFQYCSGWTSPSPGDSPGQSGTGSQFTITAPAGTGTYTIYSFSGQYTDCTAAIAAYSSAVGTAQGTITVP